VVDGLSGAHERAKQMGYVQTDFATGWLAGFRQRQWIAGRGQQTGDMELSSI
jgi:hypothetical protein